MLPCVCSVIDHRWRQNVVRTKKKLAQLGAAECVTDVLTTSHFDVLWDLLLNRCMATWNLFVLYNKELKYTEKCFFISNFATLTNTKIALWRNLLSTQNEANWLVAMLSKELWLVQRITQLSNWIVGCRHICVCPLIDHSRRTNQNARRAELII